MPGDLINNHNPRRDDKVAAWLKEERDSWPKFAISWNTINELLDCYRLHADTGTPLDEIPDIPVNECCGYRGCETC